MRLPALRRLPGAVLALAVLAPLAAGAAFTAADAPAAAAPAVQPDPAPVPMTTAGTGDFRLRWRNDDRREAAALRRAVNGSDDRVRLGTLLDTQQGRRQARHKCTQATRSGSVLHGFNRTSTDWWCLPRSNAASTDWTPQGISSTEDSQQQGTVDGRKAFVFSWHSGGVGQSGLGTRLSFLDPRNGRYMHVLLVEPRPDGNGRMSYTNLTTHAGGVAWYLNYLFVADTRGGLHVFDMHYLLDLANSPAGSTQQTDRVGRYGNTYYARGYSFALPRIGTWANQGDALYDFASVDRSSPDPEILTGEWCNLSRPNASCRVGRVARWRASDLTDFVGTDPFSGTARARSAYHLPTPYTQGAVSWNGCYNTDKGGAGSRPLLITTRPGRTALRTQRGALGLQDLTLYRSTNRLWTVTEHPDTDNRVRRVLYGVPRPSCP